MEFISSKKRKTEIFSHVKERLTNDETLRFHLAIDSKRRKNLTTYIVAVVLYSPSLKKGAEVWWKIYIEKTPKTIELRLWRECELAAEWSVTFYENLKSYFIQRKNLTVHLDLNPDPKWRSSRVHDSGKGWIDGLGFKCVTKFQNENWACRAADNLT